MSTIYDKDSVVTLLDRLERVCREVRGLPEDVKQGIAVQAGCLVNDLDELEGLVEQCKTVVEDDLCDGDDTVDLDLDNDDHYKSVLDAMVGLGSINDRDQINIIKEALEASDCFDANIEGLNSMFRDIDKPWFVISANERDTALEACKTLTTLLDNE